jgi:O-acetyl-ADP-ribose deacetylase (regulator of RNase III)
MNAFFDGRIVVKTGDITQEHVDAVVNAANPSLMGGGGVDGAIHKAGGVEIRRECMKIRKKDYPDGLPVGEAVATTGGELPADYIIHTVGPVWGQEEENEDELLIRCYFNSLKITREKDLISIAFPSISTGAYGFPKDRAAKLVGEFLAEYIPKYSLPKTIDLVFFSESDMDIFLENCGWE